MYHPLKIGIAGPSGSGKTTLAAMIGSDIRSDTVMISQPIKEILALLTPYSVQQMSHGEWREAPIPGHPTQLSIREAMQKTGDFFKSLLGEDVFINAALRQADTKRSTSRCVLFTDVRTELEQQRIIDDGGIVIILRRDNLGDDQVVSKHATETSYMNLVRQKPDLLNEKIFIVDNNGTYFELQDKVYSIIQLLNRRQISPNEIYLN